MVNKEEKYHRSYLSYERGDYQESKELFLELLLAYPFEERFWFGYAASCQGLKEYDNAVRAWAISVTLNNKNPYSYFHAGECLFSLKRFNEALFTLTQSKALPCEMDLVDKIASLEKACNQEVSYDN